MMKTRFLFLLFCTCMLGHASYAQTITFGPVLGAHLNLTSINSSRVSTKPSFSYTAGAFARVKILKFYVQPEVMYARRGVNLSIAPPVFIEDANDLDVKLRYDAMDANLMLGFQVFKLFDDAVGLRLHTGPGMSYFIGSSVYNDKNIPKESLDAEVDPYIVNWQFGVGLDLLNRFFVDFRYGQGLTNVMELWPYTIKSNQVSVLVAYKLIKDR